MFNIEVTTHIENLKGDTKQWISLFVDFMRKNYPELPEVMSFQMPTYKLGEKANRNYISFGFGKNHFSLHTMDFDYINVLRDQLSKPGKGKGCVNVPFNNIDEQSILFTGIAEIVKRNQK